MTTDRQASAQLTLQAAQRASVEASGHVVTNPRYYLLLVGLWLLLCLYLAPFLFFPLVQRLPMESWIWIAPLLSLGVPVILFLFGIVGINNWYNRKASAKFARIWAGYGIPDAVEARYTSGEDGFTMRTERGEFTSFWPSVISLAKVSEGWVVTSDLSTYLIPSTAFDDKNSEARFVSAILARLDDAAVARSSDAQAFVSAEQSPEAPPG